MDQWPDARRRLAILLWATDPSVPDLCATPFFHAAAAAAMEIEAEPYFVSRAVRLLVPRVAASLAPEPGGRHPASGLLPPPPPPAAHSLASPHPPPPQPAASPPLL